MTASNHPASLEAFVAGRLSDDEAAAVLAHLNECEQCLEGVDRLWAEYSTGIAEMDIPEPASTTTSRIERRLVHRLHRSDLWGRTIWLGTFGLLNTLTAMLRPLAGNRRSKGVQK